MNVEFASNELRRRAGEASEGTRAWGSVVARKYVQRVRQLYVARDMRDLTALQLLRVHRLHGDRAGLWTMALHDRWRLVFSNPEAGTIRVEEVSNHYDD
jgi:plasmid maintenance system killer protein